MSGAHPRGTYMQVAESLRQRIEEDPNLVVLPSVSELRLEFGGVSRTLVNRALNVLKTEGLVASSQGSGWRVVREGGEGEPLAERMLAVLDEGQLKVGDAFLSEEALCQRFGRSRTAVRSALAQLEGAGWLEKAPGKPRIVKALRTRGEEQQQ